MNLSHGSYENLNNQSTLFKNFFIFMHVLHDFAVFPWNFVFQKRRTFSEATLTLGISPESETSASKLIVCFSLLIVNSCLTNTIPVFVSISKCPDSSINLYDNSEFEPKQEIMLSNWAPAWNTCKEESERKNLNYLYFLFKNVLKLKIHLHSIYHKVYGRFINFQVQVPISPKFLPKRKTQLLVTLSTPLLKLGLGFVNFWHLLYFIKLL